MADCSRTLWAESATTWRDQCKVARGEPWPRPLDGIGKLDGLVMPSMRIGEHEDPCAARVWDVASIRPPHAACLDVAVIRGQMDIETVVDQH